ncbi:MerR family transcriptional regulator [Asaia sp. HN010]|uniref:MerR family transcriptional regulator n=1 Tax=Asaia sp. HN010 TaxID=3081233 RepID=UPI00301600B1
MTTTHASPELSRVTEEKADLERLVKGPNAYRTISEVADELHVPQHVLRFWETRFPEVKPLKRGGGRRYYSPEDVDLLRHITDLLYVQGYTIKGVQRILKESPQGAPVTAVASTPVEREEIHPIVAEDGAEIRHAESGDGEAPRSGAETLGGPNEEIRPTFDIPAFQDNDRQGETVLPSRGIEIEPVTDPGEETAASDVPDPVEENPGGAHDQASNEDAPIASSESVIASVLFDELLDLRARQERWQQERKALRLALDDVLNELDNLREMVPDQG